MNQTNVELDHWRLLWQAHAEGPDAAAIRARVERETRLRKVLLVAPVLVTVAVGGAMIAWAVAAPSIESVAFAVESWLFIVLVWVAALWIDRGTWRPLGNTTSAFLDISIRRCRSDISGLRLAVLLYVGQFAVILVLHYYLETARPPELFTAWPVIALGWIGFPMFLAFVFWYGRRKRNELDRLLALRRQLTED